MSRLSTSTFCDCSPDNSTVFVATGNCLPLFAEPYQILFVDCACANRVVRMKAYYLRSILVPDTLVCKSIDGERRVTAGLD